MLDRNKNAKHVKMQEGITNEKFCYGSTMFINAACCTLTACLRRELLTTCR